MTIVFIILVCVLVPLIVVLVIVVWLFRRNRKNAINIAIQRRNSSIKAMEEKMEGKGELNIFGGKKQGDDTVTGMMAGPIDGMDKVRYIQQVPTDDEIKELMRGKSAPEKKVLLKEIEKARQAKIHMEYLLEQ